jgi:hypothetical protein
MAGLRIKNGPLAGQTFEVVGEVVLGRENADLTIDDAEASRRHAVVRLQGGAVEVEDLGSSNGTFVNGERIEGPTRVGGGAKIRVGTTEFEVEGVIPVGATKASAIADPQATRARAVADPQATRARAVVEPQATQARPIAEPQPTQARRVQPGPPPAPPSSIPVTERPPPTAVVGTFQPPSRARGRGLASRSWLPVVLSFGTVIITAVALVIYFATR